MWYLQARTLFLLLAYVVLAGTLRRRTKPSFYGFAVPALSIAFLALIDWQVCLFFAAYLLVGIGCILLLTRFCKPGVFALVSAIAVLPFFLGRLPESAALPFPMVTIGVAFGMLKLIDVYFYIYYAKQKVSIPVFVDFVLLLPVITAGPIFRYRDFLASHNKPLPFDARLLTDCCKRSIRGLFKKIVVVRFLSYAMAFYAGSAQHWYVSALVVVLSYLLIFMDLSGYSDIAIAFGRLAGYNVPENFKKPWTAASFTQFWRSWHISLSDWIREHVYVMVGRRKMKRIASAAIGVFTMLVMSLWHGFKLTYLLAGCYNGALLAAENLMGLTTVNRRKTKPVLYWLRCICVNFLFAVNTLVFTLDTQQLQAVLRGFVHL